MNQSILNPVSAAFIALVVTTPVMAEEDAATLPNLVVTPNGQPQPTQETEASLT